MLGKTISHYKILEKLGEGGMGVVYKAKDTRLDRFVALKFLSSVVSENEEEKQRFIHEAKAASALQHHNICTIHEIDETEDGQMFICMDYYDGSSLKEKIDAGHVSIEEAIDIAAQVAAGLEKAHQKGVVHRDIKPANIMITEEGVAKILDFGLAKLHGQIKLTKAGSTLGTPAYMSPEQAKGEEVDTRTDLFSLGVVFYEMLTGRLPFKGDYDQAIIYSLLNEPPQPISDIRSHVPKNVENVVVKCLQKQPGARYQTASELLTDLTGDAPRQKPVAPKVRQFWQFIRLTVFSLAIMLAGIVYFAFFTEPKESKERVPIAVVDFVNQTNEPELNGLSGMLITSLEQSRRLEVMSRARMFDELKKMGKSNLSFVDEATGREIAKRARVSALAVATIRKLGQIYTIDFKVIDPVNGAHLFTAREQGQGQESILGMIDRLSEKTRIDLKEQPGSIKLASRGVGDVTTANFDAYQHYFQGEQLINQLKVAQAEEEYRKAIALDSTFALAWYRLAYAIEWNVGSTALAREPLQKAVGLIDRLPEKEKYLLRALAARIEGGHAATLPILKEMENFYPNEKEMLYEIGDYAFHANQFSTAIQYLENVLALDPTHERALMHLVMAYRSAGEFAKVDPVLDRLAAVNQHEAYMQAGETQLSLGDYDRAVDCFSKAYELDSSDPQMLFNFIRTYNSAGRYEQALKYAEKMISEHGSPLAYMCLAWTYEWSGDLDRALQASRTGVQHFPNDHTLQAGMGQVYAMQGEYDKAEAHFRQMTEAPSERMQRQGFRQLAGFYPYLGRYSKMMQMLDKGIEFAWSDNDSNSVARQTVAKAYWMYWGRRNKQEALAELAKVAHFPNVTDDVYYWSLALLYAEMGDLAKAVTAAKRTVHPNWKLAVEASIHAAKQEWQQAIGKLEKLNKLRPEYQPVSRYLAAQYYLEMGEYDKAIAEVGISQGFYSAGRQGHYGAGRHAFAYPLGFHLRGKIYERKGNKRRATENTERFLQLWKDADRELPAVIEARERLARLGGSTPK